MNTQIALFNSVVSKHRLNQDKSPSGCHRFWRGAFRASSKKIWTQLRWDV